jgi:transcriptional regulator with XRE-family HTH domain
MEATEEHIGKRIRETREAQNISRGDFATRLGVTRPAVSMIESGARTPSLSLAQRAAEVLGVPLSYLVGRM